MSPARASDASDSMAIEPAVFSRAERAASAAGSSAADAGSSLNGRTDEVTRPAMRGVAASRAALRRDCAAARVSSG